MIGRHNLVLLFAFASLMILVGAGKTLADDSRNLKVNQRIIARWFNNKYYHGKLAGMKDNKLYILFDDGDKIVHSIHDVTAVIPDKQLSYVEFGEHVLAKKGPRYHLGFVINVGDRVKVALDDNSEDLYPVSALRIFPQTSSPHKAGARIFARWTDKRYYRGFVAKETATTVIIRNDRGHIITLQKSDKLAVILDHLPCHHDIFVGTRVIGFWPGRDRYYSGVVTSKSSSVGDFCLRGASYNVQFDDGDKRVENFYHIRRLSCS